MKPVTKNFIKKLLKFDLIIFVSVFLASLYFLRDCGDLCEERGALIGHGVGQFIVLTNLIAGFVHWWRNHKNS